MKDEYIIDASGKALGRLASDIALHLRGKHQPSWRRDRCPETVVRVKNLKTVYISGQKRREKFYYHFSGYPGGLRKRSLQEILDKYPERLIRLVVRRMLPTNRLRDRILKNLIFDK